MKKIIEKIKKFYKEHRVFVILMAIVVVCLIIMLILMFKYFYFGSGNAPKRTCTDIKEGTIGDYIQDIKETGKVKDVNLRLAEQSNIAYITIDFDPTISLIEAQSKASASLESFSEEEKGCYDFQFVLNKKANESNEAFHLMGAKNKASSTVSWNANNTVSSEEN